MRDTAHHPDTVVLLSVVTKGDMVFKTGTLSAGESVEIKMAKYEKVEEACENRLLSEVNQYFLSRTFFSFFCAIWFVFRDIFFVYLACWALCSFYV